MCTVWMNRKKTRRKDRISCFNRKKESDSLREKEKERNKERERIKEKIRREEEDRMWEKRKYSLQNKRDNAKEAKGWVQRTTNMKGRGRKERDTDRNKKQEEEKEERHRKRRCPVRRERETMR